MLTRARSVRGPCWGPKTRISLESKSLSYLNATVEMPL